MSGDHHHDIAHDRRALWIVLALNFAMFVLEIWQGTLSNSSSLIADSMDFLSDSFSYGITIYVLTKPLKIRAHASLFKASLMLLLAVFALYQGISNVISGEIPEFATMGWVAALALIANLISAALLYRGGKHRDSNMKSVWLCSRNDAIANVLILIAAGLVYATGTLWPDLAVALFIAGLEGSSALKIIKEAKQELRHGKR
jgi:cation diffusion facilitator family transporter